MILNNLSNLLIYYLSISNYLSRNGFNLNNNDLKSLISRLDRDWDGKISYEEFKEIFYLTIQSNPSKKISESNNNNSDFINKQSILLTENQQQNNEQNQNNLNSNIQDKPEEMKKTINSQFSSSGLIKNSPTIDLFN
jgi:gas vesicle protein